MEELHGEDGQQESQEQLELQERYAVFNSANLTESEQVILPIHAS